MEAVSQSEVPSSQGAIIEYSHMESWIEMRELAKEGEMQPKWQDVKQEE